jgi:hypothetical protein
MYDFRPWLALAATVNLVRHERRLGRAGAGALIDLAIVALAVSFAFGALMFGVSTAMVFAVIQRLLLTRFEDLRY